MRFHEFKADGSTLAVRTINRYADEVGKDSMDYDMFKKSAELLDKQISCATSYLDLLLLLYISSVHSNTKTVSKCSRILKNYFRNWEDGMSFFLNRTNQL